MARILGRLRINIKNVNLYIFMAAVATLVEEAAVSLEAKNRPRVVEGEDLLRTLLIRTVTVLLIVISL
jgi:hypothetical protein